MRQSDLIADYLDALARELSFDVALSRRVRAEIEDHLWQVTDRCPSFECQEQAVADFGDPRDLALKYLTVSLLTQIRSVGFAMIGASVVIYIAMEVRVMWYGLMQWKMNAQWETVRAIGMAIDRGGFLVAISIALIGWVYISTRRAPIHFHVEYNKEINRCVVLCGAVASGLIVSVITETVLTAIRLLEMGSGLASLVPILSVFVELAAPAVLVFHIFAAIRRTAIVASLVHTDCGTSLREAATLR